MFNGGGHASSGGDQGGARRVSNPGDGNFPPSGIQPFERSGEQGRVANAPARPSANTWKDRGMSIKARSVMTMTKLGNKLDKRVTLDNERGQKCVNLCYLHGVVPWILILLVFGGVAGIVVYYIMTSGIQVDMSLKSFLVQDHPLVQAEQGVLGAIPWCIKPSSCYWNKCPVKNSETGAQSLWTPYDDGLLNRRHRRGPHSSSSSAAYSASANADPQVDAMFELEMAMQEVSENWTSTHPKPDQHLVEYPEHLFPNGKPKGFVDSIYFNPTEIQPGRNPGVIMSWVQHFAQYFEKSWRLESRHRRASSFDINLIWQGLSGDVLTPEALAEMRNQEKAICDEIKRYTGVGIASADIKTISRYLYVDGFTETADVQTEAFINAQLDYAALPKGGTRDAFPDSIGSEELRYYGSNDMERTDSDGAWRSQYIMTTLTIQQDPTRAFSGSSIEHGKHWINFLEQYAFPPSSKTKKLTMADGSKVKLVGKGGPRTQFIYVADSLSQTQLMLMLLADVLKAGIALGLIAAYVLIHTGSPFLTIMGIMNVVLAFPAGFWAYTGLFGKESLPILTPVTLIVCIGIAVDDVFVFIDTFKQTDMEGGLVKRLAKTFSAAASATLFTTITSAAAFAANTVSDIGALSNFGLYTALVIVANYLILIMLIPTSLGFWWRYLAPCEAKLFICCTSALPTSDSTSDDPAEEGDPDSYAGQRTRKPSNFVMSRIGADQKSDPLKINSCPPNYVTPPDYNSDSVYPSDASSSRSSTGSPDSISMTRKQRNKQHRNHHRVSVQNRRQASLNNTLDGDEFGAQIAAAGVISEYDGGDAVEDEQQTSMQKLLWKMGTFVVKYKYFVIGFYALFTIIFIWQATSLQPSQEGPQLFVPDSNLGRAASLVNTFSDFSATAGSSVDIPPLSSANSDLADLASDPANQELLDGAIVTCNMQYKGTGALESAWQSCPTGTELNLNSNSIECVSKICAADECCEATRSCKDYIAGIDPDLCSSAGMQSKVNGNEADITCTSEGGCQASDCCTDNQCDVFFQNNPAQSTTLCSGKKYADTTSTNTCANTATCTEGECCVDNPTCGDSSFAGSSCNGKTHLKDNQNDQQCAGKTCVASDCCEANEQCQAYFDAAPGTCASNNQVDVVATTTCDDDPCTMSDCCKDQNCATAYGNNNAICSAGLFHLKDDAATITGTTVQMIESTCCDANPNCPASSSILCDAKKHLKLNSANIQCATGTCTSDECCEANEACSSASHSSMCATTDKNYDASETGNVCDAELCTDQDCCIQNCAEQNPNLCGSGVFLDASSGKKCAADPCTVDECCNDNPACDTFSAGCTGATSLVDNPADLTCEGETCDTDDCCVANPTCNSFTCPDAGTVNHGDDRPCAGKECTAGDCCKQLTCASIGDLDDHCGASRNARASSTTCPGFSCGQCPYEDNDNLNSCGDCCEEQSNPKCKDWVEDNPSFCGGGKIVVTDNTRCDGQCTSTDNAACCVAVTNPTCDSIAADACGSFDQTAKENAAEITCSSTPCVLGDCCESYRTCADELSSDPAFCSNAQKLTIDSPEEKDCTTGSCSTSICCRERTCSDSGAPSCSAGTFPNAENTCLSASKCTQADCCEASPNCGSVGGEVCTTSGKMLMQGVRSDTICSGNPCTEEDCCVDEPNEVPIDIVFDCDEMSQEEIDQVIVAFKEKVADETGLSTNEFTIELCNTEARSRRGAGGVPAVRGRAWNIDGSRVRAGALSRSRRETTTMIIKLDGGLSTEEISGARDVLVDEEDPDPDPLDILEVDPDSGNFTVTGNLSFTTTTTTATTAAPVLPTEAIVERPTKTRFAIGLGAPYVRRSANPQEYAGGKLRLIPVTGQVQDERPIFDLNFNHAPNVGFLTLNDLAVTLSGDSNILVGTELYQYREAKLQAKTITDMVAMCSAIANSTGLVNPGQLDTACAVQNLEVAIRYMQPDCETLDSIEQAKLLDGTVESGWTRCTTPGRSCPYGDFSMMVTMVAFSFDSKFTTSSGNDVKVANYEALEALLAQLRTDYPLYDIRQANKEYGLAINEVLAVSGAIWGVIVSLILVFIAVVMFKAHGMLTLIVSIMIISNLGVVVGMFHAIGWVLGGDRGCGVVYLGRHRRGLRHSHVRRLP